MHKKINGYIIQTETDLTVVNAFWDRECIWVAIAIISVDEG